VEAISTVTLASIIDDTKSRFFPRDLIILKNRRRESVMSVIGSAFDELNKNTSQDRFYEFQVSARTIDLTQYSAPGVTVNHIVAIIPAINSAIGQVLGSLDYAVFGGNSFNALRNNDAFLAYVFEREMYLKIKNMFSNKQMDYTQVGNKVYLGSSFEDVSKVLMFFVPKFTYEPNTTEAKTHTAVVSNATTYTTKLDFFPIDYTITLTAGLKVLTDSAKNGILVTSDGTITGFINYMTGDLTLSFANAFSGTITMNYIYMDYSWELYTKEHTLVLDHCEIEFLEKESRAQSEWAVIGVDTNADKMMEEARAKREAMADNKGRRPFIIMKRW